MGLLTTRGHALETLARATHIVFDKTGTLTYGRLQLEDVINLHCQSREQALQIAAALESGSEHPIAKAIIESAPQEKLQVTDISALTGRGIQARIDGKLYRIGKPDFVAELVNSKEYHEAFRQQKTVVALADEQRILALFVMADVIREDAPETIQSLSKLGLKVTLLSGNQASVVSNVAQRLGIENAHAGMLPDEKLEQIQAMQQAGDIVAMVGDGVNDAPALEKPPPA